MSRGLWTRETVALLLLSAYAPLAGFWLFSGGTDALFRLSLTVLIVLIWHLVFLLVRAQAPSLSGLVTALAVAMLAPEELGLLQMALGISFGVVMGELVFGGWGRNVVNPATIALAFLGFGFPASPWPVFDPPIAWAAIPAALLGVAFGVMPAGLIAGAVLLGGFAAISGVLSEVMVYTAGIALVLLVADPVTSASTALGRWLNGALYAALVTLFALGWAGAAPLQIAVAAALLASLAAPVLDDLAIGIWVARRRSRHGRT